MLKRLLLFAAAVLLLPLTAAAQWTFEGIFPQDTLAVNSGHGIAVDPDGKVWFQPFSATDSVQVPDLNNEFQPVRVIYVFNADGSPASFSPIKFVDLPGGERDTLGGEIEVDANGVKAWNSGTRRSGRGLRADYQGNILVAQDQYLYKLDYQTGAGMARAVNNDICAYSAPAVDENGNVYAAPVCPGPPIQILDSDLQFVDNAVDVTHGFSRSFEVSADGNTIYWAGYTNHAVVVYQRPDEFSPYDSVGVVLQGMDSESMTINRVTGDLWLSAGSPNDLPNRYPDVSTDWLPQTWYAFSLDSLVPNEAPPAPLNLFSWQNSPEWSDGRPRGLAFSPDGETAYVTQFSQIAPSVQVFNAAPFVAPTSRSVTVTLNTASLPDTTSMASLVQVRGCLTGCENDVSELPGGNVIAWNDQTTLEPANVGGDYWEATFDIPVNAELQFKFYSQQAEDTGIGGWEDGGNHIVEAGTNPITLPVHFFEKGDDQEYDWRPFESKQDSVGVWFRVYMNTEVAANNDFDPATSVIGVRGDDLSQTGPLDWGNTKVILNRESDDDGATAYHLYSGVAYYPTSMAGSVQNYKFVIENDGVLDNDVLGWEESPDRPFTIPASDTTLHWVYFSDSPPLSGAEPTTANIIFSVDLDPLEQIGIFRRARGDSLQVRGSFNGWDGDNPDDSFLFRVPGEPLFEAEIPLTLIPETVQNYKYYINFNVPEVQAEFGVDVIPSGWEEPISTAGGNRQFMFTGNDEDLGIQFYNDVLPGNIIPAGTSIDLTFNVDMTPALTDDSDPFDPAVDTVTVQVEDPMWSLTQNLPLTPRSDDPNLGDVVDLAQFAQTFHLTDDDGDNVYTGTLTVNGPTYSGLQYKLAYGESGTFTVEAGGSTASQQGRRRIRYIQPNADGSWPTSFSLAQDVYQATGDLPFETNPAIEGTSVEEVDGELPTSMTLSQNYPNPFNPVTTIEYTVNQTMDVKLRVYNVLGQMVTTLVDGVQQAATYRVSFDAADLASGIYIYQLETSAGTLTKQMILMK